VYPAGVKIVGLTGGIGSGKSTASKILEELGAVVIHADLVGHQVYRPQTEGWHRVVEAFGTSIVQADGCIDRKRLGALVFGDPHALARLNAIVHPLIFAEIQRQLDALRAAGRVEPVVVEAAILVEANWLALVDDVWLVTASREAVIQRIAGERGLTPAEVGARINAQLNDAQRRRFAHVVIENTGSVAQLRFQIETAWKQLTAARQ
jgi:dephospho-CoA kinase